MNIEEMKGYGVAMSDFEASWDPKFKSKLKKTSQRIILSQFDDSKSAIQANFTSIYSVAIESEWNNWNDFIAKY